jgi:hypothetical protein
MRFFPLQVSLILHVQQAFRYGDPKPVNNDFYEFYIVSGANYSCIQWSLRAAKPVRTVIFRLHASTLSSGMAETKRQPHDLV